MLGRKLLGAGGLVGAGGGGGGITVSTTVSGIITAATTTTDVSLTGLSLQEDDLIIMLIAADFDNVGAKYYIPVDFDVSKGWFSLYDGAFDLPEGHLLGYWCGSSPPSTVRVRGSSDSNPDSPYIIQALRGVDKRIFDARSYPFTTGSGTNADPPSVTTTTDGALMYCFSMLDDDDTTATFPSGYTNTAYKSTEQALTQYGCTVAVASKIITSAGAEDPGAFVFGSSDSYAVGNIAFLPDQSAVDSWSITEVGRAQYTSTDAGTTYALPSGLQENDYVLVFCGATNGLGSSGNPMNSSGWTTLRYGAAFTAFYGKVMGSTPDTSVDIDDPSGGYESSVSIIAFRGVDTTTPQDVAMSYSGGSSVFPSITTATNNALVLRGRLIFNNFAHSMGEWPLGYAGHLWTPAAQFDASSPFAFNLCYTQQASSGATGTLNLASAFTATDSSFTMALRPA